MTMPADILDTGQGDIREALRESNRKEEKNDENPEKCCRRADRHREKADW